MDGSVSDAVPSTEELLANFETDFWRDEKNRRSWNEIQVGEERETHPVTLTLKIIQDYARAIGDLNPLYFEEEYAKRSRFGGLIAPPTIHVPLMFLCTSKFDWMRTPGTVNAGQNWYYRRPARPGDVVTLRARALDKLIRKGRMFVIHDNVFCDQNGQVLCS
ncbi:MAG: MaoC family dehydratase, partial [Coriobacteriia bacterium]